jgi:hypothetical protein
VKTFERHKNVAELRAECHHRAWLLDSRRYDKHGDDHVRIMFIAHGVVGTMLFNTFNGKFFGETEEGQSFDSSDASLDGQAWFAELLSATYVAKQAGSKKPPPREPRQQESTRRPRIVVVYGKQGVGKSRLQQQFLRHFGLRRVVDGWDGASPLSDGDLAITNIEPPALRPPRGAQVIDFTTASMSEHLCHAIGCGLPVRPEYLMCGRHWCHAAEAAIEHIAEQEGLGDIARTKHANTRKLALMLANEVLPALLSPDLPTGSG